MLYHFTFLPAVYLSSISSISSATVDMVRLFSCNQNPQLTDAAAPEVERGQALLLLPTARPPRLWPGRSPRWPGRQTRTGRSQPRPGLGEEPGESAPVLETRWAAGESTGGPLAMESRAGDTADLRGSRGGTDAGGGRLWRRAFPVHSSPFPSYRW
jgi:hypothetical protein